MSLLARELSSLTKHASVAREQVAFPLVASTVDVQQKLCIFAQQSIGTDIKSATIDSMVKNSF